VTTKVLSGGGPQDVYATVQVQEGIVVVYQDNAGISSENFSAVMVKVLIKG
jgi:hypothetical protein